MKYNKPTVLNLILCGLLTGCETANTTVGSIESYRSPYDSMYPNTNLTESTDSPFNAKSYSDHTTIPHVYRKIMPNRVSQHDQDWVSMQPAHGYTIQVAKDVNAARVAHRLIKVPHMHHTAEVQTREGFVGVFGSYATQDEAAKAIQQLPDAIRKEATVQSWQAIQSL